MSQADCIEVQCNCGRVAFRVTCRITDLYACHCSLCRRATGTMGVTVAVVPDGTFAWLRGEHLVRRWQMPGHDWECSFCANCGTQLPGRNDASTTYVPAGLLDAVQDRLVVRHHVWVSSKATWHVIGDEGQQHPEGLT
ncbi:GFA family protein [Marilutibacter spongiae]|uniref:GFA family protein n=1 Tax=Marilutibacter spongiae TaxID=2025720 RepID=A0A7W3TN33_9GAMM|nr:GFA family protein [Lysobacter spongiae]MBB1061373.1 GFA family protein [Lysobacter spongiae]